MYMCTCELTPIREVIDRWQGRGKTGRETGQGERAGVRDREGRSEGKQEQESEREGARKKKETQLERNVCSGLLSLPKDGRESGRGNPMVKGREMGMSGNRGARRERRGRDRGYVWVCDKKRECRCSEGALDQTGEGGGRCRLAFIQWANTRQGQGGKHNGEI